MYYDLKVSYTQNTKFILFPRVSVSFLFRFPLITFLTVAYQTPDGKLLKGTKCLFGLWQLWWECMVVGETLGCGSEGTRLLFHSTVDQMQRGIYWATLSCFLCVQCPSLQDDASHTQGESSKSANPLWKSPRWHTQRKASLMLEVFLDPIK